MTERLDDQQRADKEQRPVIDVAMVEYLTNPADVLALAKTNLVHVLDLDGSISIVIYPGTIADLGTRSAGTRTVEPPMVAGEHPRSPGNTRDEIELFLRDAYAAGCSAAQSRSLFTAMEYAEREAPKLRAILSASERRLTLDNERQVFFYEQDHYYLSNFSAFSLRWKGWTFPTSEHAYHWERFNAIGISAVHCRMIQESPSAHSAFRYAQEHKADQRIEWDAIKVGVMRDILRAKASQHEYARRKLLQTGDRELIENSWRDPFWGWGENRDGKNMLGKLWMEVRAELRAVNATDATTDRKANG